MKDFYEILGLKSKATKDEIKKSYFNLVRKYPLDIYELEFMEIRRAYETLSNDKIRKQYDLIPLLPMEMKESYNSAMILFDEGDFANGIKILEKILKSNAELVIIKLFLAEAYLKNNNIGKAIKAYEELTIEEPENAAFAGYLAETYLTRGWQKKAIETYNKAINLDCDNISLWIGLSDAYIKNNEYEQAKEVLENVLNKGTENSDSTTIYSNLIMIDIGLEIYSSIDRYLDKFRELSANYPETKDNAAWTLANIAELLLNIERVDEAKKVIDVSIEFSSEEGRILEIKEKIDNFDDGHNPFVREEPKIGRNDPCICGSGKKYKKCCGK